MKITIAAAVVLAVGALGSMASAQQPAPTPGAMTPGAMTSVPAADMKKVDECKAMKHDAMMKSSMCMKMMKLYPNAFAGSVSSN